MDNRNRPAVEMMRAEDSNFIPEIELDPNTGLPKPKPFKQKEYESLSEYGG